MANSVADGIKTIFSVWGHREGWVRVPAKFGSRWKEKFFRWPDDSNKIRKWIKQAVKNQGSIYWCPTVFIKPRGLKENVEPKINVLWADLDEVHPSELELKPTIAWESSPGRYQCLWLLKKPIKAEKAENINRDITYTIGADKGGWDLTQVLRIPGLRNWKYKNGPKGRLMWDDGRVYSPKQITRWLLERNDSRGSEESFDGDEGLSEDVINILRRYSKSLDKRVYELFFTPEEDVSVGERSDRLWELECLLAEAGVSIRDSIQLVKLSPWNKFKGRRNEDEQIENEVFKAREKVGAVGTKQAINLGPEGRITARWESYDRILGTKKKKPEWLIEGVWQKESHGFVAGEPKTYKSVITTDIAVSVASGEPFLGKFEVHNSGPVLIVQEENHPYLVQDRLRKIAGSRGLLKGKVTTTGRNILRVKFPPVLPIEFLNQYGFDLTNEEDRKLIQKKVEQVKPVLVIFDPLYLMLGNVDENSAKDLRPVLNWLLELRYAYSTGIMLVHHWNKGGVSSRGGQRMLGSTTLHAWVESALYCSVKNEIEHIITVEREFRSFPKPGNINIQFNMGDPGQEKYEPLVEDEKAVTMDKVIEILLSTSSLTEKELCAYLDCPRSTARNYLEKAVSMGLVEKIGGSKGRGKEKRYVIIRRGNNNEGNSNSN